MSLKWKNMTSATPELKLAMLKKTFFQKKLVLENINLK